MDHHSRPTQVGMYHLTFIVLAQTQSSKLTVVINSIRTSLKSTANFSDLAERYYP